MRIIDPKTTPTKDLHQFLLGCVSPRPIAFVSTMDKDGNPNLAPYSFFNAFSSNPPIVVFSSNRRVSNNTTKDTLDNIINTKELVINMVNHDIVRQMTIASIEFPTNISEFEKSGLTPIKADLVRPYRVKESPAHLECKVNDIITLGEHGGAGHLIICEIIKMHISEDVIDDKDRIDPHKIDLMGRMGRAFYVRASGTAISSIYQPVTKVTVGYDNLPDSIKSSTILTANDIAMISGLEQLPNDQNIKDFLESDSKFRSIIQSSIDKTPELHQYAKVLLTEDKRWEAAMVLMH